MMSVFIMNSCWRGKISFTELINNTNIFARATEDESNIEMQDIHFLSLVHQQHMMHASLVAQRHHQIFI